jgi:SAM-dependent methyltransferase
MSKPTNTKDTYVSQRKAAIREHADNFASDRQKWIKRSRYFHEIDKTYMRFLIPTNKRVLELGCGSGDLLAALEPGVGVGVDLSATMVDVAKAQHPNLKFIVGDVEDPILLQSIDQAPFDFIILSDTIGFLDDCQSTFEALHTLCDRETRIIVNFYSHNWSPILALLEKIGLKMPQQENNYLSLDDIANIFELADFDIVKQDRHTLLPARLFGLGPLINRYLGAFPIIRSFCLRNYTLVRSMRKAPHEEMSASVIIPCRNEKGNIEAAINRLPQFCEDLEVIFIEGHSKDGTFDEIKRVAMVYGSEIKIRYAQQDGIGKHDAMKKGYAMAEGDILMILDADLTVAPEDIPKFYQALISGKGNFINGSRLIYPMQDQAMRFLNLKANMTFAYIFSWLLNQRLSDTLCGTKVLTKEHYHRIEEGRAYFGDFDPFGDFDLIFGASKQNLKIIDLPIRYANRNYGETQISRFSHGWLLLRMVAFAFRKLKTL